MIGTETPKYKTMSVVTNTYKSFTSQYLEFVNISFEAEGTTIDRIAPLLHWVGALSIFTLPMIH